MNFKNRALPASPAPCASGFLNVSHDRMPADIRGYHLRVKHAPTRYALGPAFLDWTSQPNPYRTFAGAPQIFLPLVAEAAPTPFPGPAPAPAPLDRDSLGLFCELGFGLSAWKSADGSTWALRNNPSSGNLHPTEAYVMLGAVSGVGDSAGLYHYAPLAHALELRAGYAENTPAPIGGFLLCLTAVPWREAWKYGERAFRYCQLDAGHAIGAAAQAAAALGWRAELLAQPSDETLIGLLGLDRADASHRREAEHPDLILWIETQPGAAPPDLAALIDAPRQFFGAANRLSEDHDGWPLIDLALQFCRKPQTPAPQTPARLAPPPAPQGARPLAEAVRRRRSAQRMDGKTALPREAFACMLAAIAPGAAPLLGGFPFAPAITPVFFVHRVEALEPGLYALERDADMAARLRAAANPAFEWAPVDLGGPPLRRLVAQSAEKEATRLACLQALAGKSAFAAAMIADFDATLEKEGAFAYRRLHWEAGLIGQAFYLWASALGFDGTGIGCFFDDEVHGLLGLSSGSTQFQDVYHFTVGAAVEDARILTLPPYPPERWITR